MSTKLICVLIIISTLFSVNSLAETLIHLSLVPTKRSDVEINNSLALVEKSIGLKTMYNCKKIVWVSKRIVRTQNSAGIPTYASGNITGLIQDCDNSFEGPWVGSLNLDPRDSNSFFNLDLDLLVENQRVNSMNVNFDQDLKK